MQDYELKDYVLGRDLRCSLSTLGHLGYSSQGSAG